MLIDLRASLWRAIAGFMLGSGMGIVAGLGTGRIRVLDTFFSPVLQVVRPLPPVAIIPLVIVWFGIGEAAKVFAVAFAVFWPVWVACHHGCREVPQTYIWQRPEAQLRPLAHPLGRCSSGESHLYRDGAQDRNRGQFRHGICLRTCRCVKRTGLSNLGVPLGISC